jgi:hypothetical protein
VVVGAAEPSAHRFVVGANVIVESRPQTIAVGGLRLGGGCCDDKRRDDEKASHFSLLSQ